MNNECKTCDGKGWYTAGETDKPEQVQCPDCLGTGIASEADSVSTGNENQPVAALS